MVVTSSSLLGADELVTPALVQTFRGHRTGVKTVAFNPNLKQVASGAEDGTVLVWHFKPGQRAFRYVGHRGPVHAVAFSPSGRFLASGAGDATVKLWEPSARGRSLTLKGHSRAVRAVTFSPDDRMLLTASDDKTVKLWSVQDRRFRGSLQGHSNWVRAAALSPDGLTAASGSDDRTVRLWDVENRQCVATLNEPQEAVTGVAFHPGGNCLAAGGLDRSLRIWDTRSQHLVQQYAPAHFKGVTSVSFHQSGNFILTASEDATLKVWDVREGRLLFTVHGHAGAVAMAAFSPDDASSLFASAGAEDKTVMVWQSNLAPYNRVRTTATMSSPPPVPASPLPVRSPYIPKHHTPRIITRPAYQMPSNQEGVQEEEETWDNTTPLRPMGKGRQPQVWWKPSPIRPGQAHEAERGEEEEEEEPPAVSRQESVVEYQVPQPSAPLLHEVERSVAAVPASAAGDVSNTALLNQTLSLLAERLKLIEDRLDTLTLGTGGGGGGEGRTTEMVRPAE